MSQLEDVIFNTLKSALSLGGGVLGGAAGVPEGGLGAIPGAVVGAGLGNGLGQGIQNVYDSYAGQPVDNFSAFSQIPVGGAQEIMGQGIGGLLGKGAQAFIDSSSLPTPEVLTNGLLRDADGNLITEYHGGTTRIPNPSIENTQTGLGGQTFHTTPDLEIAQSFAARSKMRSPDPDAVQSIVNSYYQNPTPSLNLNADSAPTIGRMLGLNPDQTSKAISDSMGADSLIYKNFLKQMMMETPSAQLNGLQSTGADAAQILQDQGIQRLSKPVDSWTETYNWNPGKDLVYKPDLDAQMMNNNQMNQYLDSTNGLAQAVINSLSQAAPRTQNNQ